MGKEKFIRFEAYQVNSVCEEVEKECDISNLLKKIRKSKLEDRKMFYGGEQVELNSFGELIPENESLEKYKGMKLYFFHMVKRRDDGLAIIKDKEDEELKDLLLEDDEYVAEDITGIFDTDDCILFIQRNIHSLSVTGLEEYLNYMNKKINNNDKVIKINPIMDKNVISSIGRKSTIKSITLKIAAKDIKQSNLFEAIIPGVEKWDPNYIEIKLLAGRKKDAKLCKKELNNEMEALKKKEKYRKFEVSAKDEGQKVEKFDLLKGKLVYYEKFSTEKNGKRIHVSPYAIRQKMQLIYLGEGIYNGKAFKDRIKKNI